MYPSHADQASALACAHDRYTPRRWGVIWSMVLHRASRARRVRTNSIGGEVPHGFTSGVSRETSSYKHVTPHLHRGYLSFASRLWLRRHQTCYFRDHAASAPAEFGGEIHNFSRNRARTQVILQAQSRTFAGVARLVPSGATPSAWWRASHTRALCVSPVPHRHCVGDGDIKQCGSLSQRRKTTTTRTVSQALSSFVRRSFITTASVMLPYWPKYSRIRSSEQSSEQGHLLHG